MPFRFTKRAEADVEEIADYIARDNPERACSFVVQLRRHCRALVNFPHAAPLRPELGRDIRMAVHDPYLIFCVVLSDLLEIRRVLHGARHRERL